MTHCKFIHVGDLIVSRHAGWIGVATRHAEPTYRMNNRFEIFWSDLCVARPEDGHTTDDLKNNFIIVR